jgi:hypothetical protein
MRWHSAGRPDLASEAGTQTSLNRERGSEAGGRHDRKREGEPYMGSPS